MHNLSFASFVGSLHGVGIRISITMVLYYGGIMSYYGEIILYIMVVLHYIMVLLYYGVIILWWDHDVFKNHPI